MNHDPRPGAAQSAEPTVTLIIPVRDEAAHLPACLHSVRGQDYSPSAIEILVVDGGSTDDTAAIVKREQRADPRIRLLTNHEGDLAHGLNIGLATANGDYVGYVHGRSVLPPEYVRRCIESLNETGAWSVGGRIVRVGVASMHEAIVLATSSPVGVGDSKHNFSKQAGWVEAVFPGFWRRELFDRIGLFDPDMIFNEDNELSHRIRKAGGKIWYDPAIAVKYVPRSGLRALFHQYRRYALGKTRVFRKHGRRAMRPRHVIPALWLAFLLGGGVTSLVIPSFAVFWLSGVSLYALVVTVTSVAIRRRGVPWWMIAAAIATLHLGYGVGTLQGIAGRFGRP